MHSVREFWVDQSGSLLSAELVLVGTVVTVGAVTGLQTVASSVEDEIRDVSQSIRKVNQSYSYRGFRGCFSQTAGSAFIDPTLGNPTPADWPKAQPIPPQTSRLAPVGPQYEFEDPNDDLEAPTTPADAPVTSADEKL
jgi:hypothetical protein